MTRRAAVTTAHVSRVVKGAIEGGLPVGSFIVEVVDGIVRLLPAPATAPVASPDRESVPAREALARWRRSA